MVGGWVGSRKREHCTEHVQHANPSPLSTHIATHTQAHFTTSGGDGGGGRGQRHAWHSVG